MSTEPETQRCEFCGRDVRITTRGRLFKHPGPMVEIAPNTFRIERCPKGGERRTEAGGT